MPTQVRQIWGSRLEWSNSEGKPRGAHACFGWTRPQSADRNIFCLAGQANKSSCSLHSTSSLDASWKSRWSASQPDALLYLRSPSLVFQLRTRCARSSQRAKQDHQYSLFYWCWFPDLVSSAKRWNDSSEASVAVAKVWIQVALGWAGPRAPTASLRCQLYRQQAHTKQNFRSQAFQEGGCHNQPVLLQKNNLLTERT